MTAAQSEISVTEWMRSLEVRWILPGRLDGAWRVVMVVSASRGLAWVVVPAGGAVARVGWIGFLPVRR